MPNDCRAYIVIIDRVVEIVPYILLSALVHVCMCLYMYTYLCMRASHRILGQQTSTKLHYTFALHFMQMRYVDGSDVRDLGPDWI